MPFFCNLYMESNFSDRVKDVISYSREEAIRLGHDYIGPEHLLLGLIREGEGLAITLLLNLNVDLAQLKKAIENAVRGTVTTINLTNLPLTRQAEKVLKITRLEAKLLKSGVIGTEHLLVVYSQGRKQCGRTDPFPLRRNLRHRTRRTGTKR
jgi:ATP-dependent Clp protease ATP-binding subunit ClpC